MLEADCGFEYKTLVYKYSRLRNPKGRSSDFTDASRLMGRFLKGEANEKRFGRGKTLWGLGCIRGRDLKGGAFISEVEGDASLFSTLMEQESLNIQIGAELDATLERLSRLFDMEREDLARIFLEEAAFAVEETFDRSGQLWDSVRFEYVHGGRRSAKRLERDEAIEELLRNIDQWDDV